MKDNQPRTSAGETLLLRLFLTAVLFICGSAGLVFLYFHPPGSTPWLPQCLFYRITGFYCSGCGATRALYAALHGNFPEALRYNLLLFPFLIAVCLLLWKPRLALNPWIVWPLSIILVLYWILRNIPVYPFLLLAPP